MKKYLFITIVGINNVKAFSAYTNFTPLFRIDNVDDALNILDTNINKYHTTSFHDNL